MEYAFKIISTNVDITRTGIEILRSLVNEVEYLKESVLKDREK
ncbi:hypothetical protein [Herbinix hemicellulosilytica]|nr:hypothetical protein [Herbinix hemicellulosilytica]